LIQRKKWPCYFHESDTTGEKKFEEFFMSGEVIDLSKFNSIGIVKSQLKVDQSCLSNFEESLRHWRDKSIWKKKELIEIFEECLPEFEHDEKNKDLDQKM